MKYHKPAIFWGTFSERLVSGR